MKKVASKTNSDTRGRQPTPRQTVHFELLSPGAHKVCIAGTFNGWEPETARMLQKGDGRWVKDLTLKPGTYEYRFVVDGKWEADPNADHTVMNPFGERNSLLTVSGNTNG